MCGCVCIGCRTRTYTRLRSKHTQNEEVNTVVGRPFGQVDLSLVVSSLNEYFAIHPTSSSGNAAHFSAVKSFLVLLVQHIGTEQLTRAIHETLQSPSTSPLLGMLQGTRGAAGAREQEPESF